MIGVNPQSVLKLSKIGDCPQFNKFEESRFNFSFDLIYQLCYKYVKIVQA